MRPPTSSLRPSVSVSVLENVCWQCTHRLRLPKQSITTSSPLLLKQQQQRQHQQTQSRSLHLSARSPTNFFFSSPIRSQQRLKTAYFISNNLLDRANGSSNHARDSVRGSRSRSTVASSTLAEEDASSRPSTHTSGDRKTAAVPDSTVAATATSNSVPAEDNTLLPHRRRQAQRRAALQAAAASSPDDAPTATMAPDASSVLANAAARHPADSFRRKLSALLSLSKPRLTVLVVLSAMVPYALYPVPSFLSSAALASGAVDVAGAALPSLSPLTLLFLTTGTTLCSAAANALNMLYEPDTDSRMTRTRTRPLVRKLLTTRAAVLFAVGCGLVGTLALYWGVNPTVAFLGAVNIALYAGAYTPLKRISALNTWVGAIVGGIPPLMGWAAAAGESATLEGSGWQELLFASDGSSAGGWLFAGLLFAWQFPHFMPLSWGIREEYKAAGLRMLCWINPARNARVALRYSLVFVPLCVGLCMANVTEWSFALTSLPVNAWLVREAVKFWKLEGHGGSAKGLFWASVWHLPVIMVLALAQKKGMWGRVWRSVVGEPEEEEEEWEEDEE